jgi:hypothetical protein
MYLFFQNIGFGTLILLIVLILPPVLTAFFWKKKIGSLSIRWIITFLLFGFSSSVLKAQTTHLKSSTLASIGNGLISNKNFIVHQSIGQSSVIGRFQNSGVNVGQGFLNGVLPFRKSKEVPMQIIAYPNSFVNDVRFKFVQGYNFEVAMTIFDLNGKMVFQGTKVPLNNEIEIDLDYLSSGLYLVKFKFGNSFTQTRLIKR